MKNQWILAGLMLSSLVGQSALFSDDEYMTETETQQTSSTDHMMSTYDRIKGKEITPVAGPAVSGGADIYVEASYIYWYMNELGLEYAGTNWNSNATFYANQPSSDNLAPSGRVYTPGNKASSGFKVGAGMDFDYDGWDSGVVYTWYRNHHSSAVSTSLDQSGVGVNNISNLYTLGGIPTVAALQQFHLASASSEFKLALNVIDWEVGRSFFISPKLVLRPHLGMKGMWGHQYSNWMAVLNGVDDGLYPQANLELALADQSQVNSYNKQGTWGFGTRCGLDTSWMVAKWFSFFGEWSMTTLWQYMRTTRSDVYTTVDGTIDNPTSLLVANYNDVNYHQRLHMVNPVFETQIGMRIDYMFSDDEYRFRLQAGWENQVWFGQNTFLNEFGSNHNFGYLMLQGLTVNMRLDF